MCMQTLGHFNVSVESFQALVVGSGAAGLAAAYHLDRLGTKPVALLSEGMQHGTSRNTGSDKQTYFKLSLAGAEPDSVDAMAKTLFAGGCMDGDLARVEAALSAACFARLCDLGVPFPHNEYGEAVAYRTDHDPRQRGTSAGPLTSRLMVEALSRSVTASQVTLQDRMQVIQILTDATSHRCCGLLCLNLDALSDPAHRYRVFLAPHVIWAVGGPAMLYADSVYPQSQQGATGLALAAGATLQNATEWQYGLASVRPRWNVSGSFQQVMPRYVSCDADGRDAVDFLDAAIPDPARQLDLIFRKGYEWPFDVRKVNGSSLIDLLVYQETVLKKRRVFLDFRSNPGDRPIDFSRLEEKTRLYLKRADATDATPVARLQKLNQPAFDFYAGHGIDLSRQPLEISLAAQHHNGGLAADADWQSDLKGLYPVGEVNGSHGVYRPGGSALNSGQVGAQRAATAIAAALENRPEAPSDASAVIRALDPIVENLEQQLDEDAASENLATGIRRVQTRMSRYAGPFRSQQGLSVALAANRTDQSQLDSGLKVPAAFLPQLCRYRELLLTERAYLTAMHDYCSQGGGSRGSFLCLDEKGTEPMPGLPDFFRSLPLDLSRLDQIQTLRYDGHHLHLSWRPVRPLPQPDEAFEVVWRRYRKGKFKHE